MDTPYPRPAIPTASLSPPLARERHVVLEAGAEPLPSLRLTRLLGVGGFGRVWEAVSPEGQPVALKFIDCRHQPASLVAQEVRVLLKLRALCHPNVIQLQDVCAAAGCLILKMERADGNLSELQQVYREETGRPIPSDHLLDLLEQAADGLDFLAGQQLSGMFNPSGLQHCDVKPSNLLLLADTLKIADFGLCMGSLGLTHARKFMGTVPYAAPELYEGKVTTHTDQYALAVTYCELVTGGRSILVRQPGDPIGTLPVDLSRMRASEVPVLARALDSRWTNRWPSCRAFIEALRSVVVRPHTTTRKVGSRELVALRRRKGS